MSRILSTLLVGALMFASALPAVAQQRRASPHETVSAVVDGNRVTITYGRPFTKSPTGEVREIWGKLVPYGQVWRLGADEATTLITQRPIVIGNTEIPAGAHTLFLLPNQDGTGKLVVSKQLGQWGTQYDEKNDLARIDIKREELSPANDQLLITLTGGAQGTIKIMWDKYQYVIPFTSKK